MSSPLSRAVAFLRELGLSVHVERKLPVPGFLEEVVIDAGQIHCTTGCPASNLLHEAGHLAITPGRYRPWMSGNLAAGQRRMIRDISRMDLDPDHPLVRAMLQCSDPEATAWAWAAGVAAGIDPDHAILDCEYSGTGRDIRIALAMKAYVGINGLVFAGMTRSPRRGGFPAMEKWLQDADS